MILSSVEFKLSKGDKPTVYLFKCTECGCSNFYRRKIDYKHCFLVGSYFCINCKAEHDYGTGAFYNKESVAIPPTYSAVQLALFD